MCPDDFDQLFTLHSLLKSVVIPLVYALLIGKNATDYKNIFFEKVLTEDDFKPESILSDFASGTIKTIKEMFPNAIHRGILNLNMCSNQNARILKVVFFILSNAFGVIFKTMDYQKIIKTIRVFSQMLENCFLYLLFQLSTL